MSPGEARSRFASARVARLATVDGAGRPHLVPMVFAVDGETIYSVVDAKPKRTTALRRLANVRENPQVSLLVDHYDENWDALWWVRADGRGAILPTETEADGGRARRAVAMLAERYPQQRAIASVLAVTVERWTGWSAGAAGAAPAPVQ